jgi:pyruvate-formate lyase
MGDGMMINNAERIAILRQRCMDRKTLAWKDICLPRARALLESEQNSSWQERQGLCVRQVLMDTAFAIDDLELLAGRLAPRPAWIKDEDLAAARGYLKDFPTPGGQTGHCELYLNDLFRLGIDGLAADIQSRLKVVNSEAVEAYHSFLSALEGLSIMIEHAAVCARSAVPGAPPDRQIELEAIAASCEHVAHHPPASFRDAIQLMWLTLLAVQHADMAGLIGPGHIDRTLAFYYEQDLVLGRLTRQVALALIESLYLLLNEYIYDGLAIPVMVGGQASTGEDLTNDLSYLCLEALRRTKLVYPTVGICWHESTPPELVNLGIDLIIKGYSNPAFFGDATIQRGLKALGVPDIQACNYINSTCVEITPVGASNVWVASPYYNLCGLLLEEIASEADHPSKNFETFQQKYWQRLAKAVEVGVAEQNEARGERQKYGRKPLQSIFTRDCLSRGRDIDDSGAIYNWAECSFVGLANLADSFHIIREEIYKDVRMTLSELKAILDKNFEGYDSIRSRFMLSYPKYGQDNPDVDAMAGEIVAHAVAECRKHGLLPDGSPYIPGTFVWIMHEQLGRQTGATPDGRKAGTPFADGAGPAQGRESKGPTAAILSTTQWDHSQMIGGLAFNMKFNTSLFQSPSGVKMLRDLVLTYLRRGGFETQINVVDGETLRKAQQNPEQYRDLVVRIGGYTDYFTRLSKEMQDEVMLRTEYSHA